MKSLILLAALTVTKADVVNHNYLPPNVQMTVEPNFYRNTPHTLNGNSYQKVNAYFGTPITVLDTYERPQVSRERNAAILIQDQSINGDSHSFVYKTSNGIYAQEKGVATGGVRAQGGYSYTGDDGKMYSVRYTADENGFVAQGDHLPTPPPIPKEILRALEQNARDEAAGIFDDGSYDEKKYSGYSQQKQYTIVRPSNYKWSAGAGQQMHLPPRTRRNYQRNYHKRLNQIHRFSY